MYGEEVRSSSEVSRTCSELSLWESSRSSRDVNKGAINRFLSKTCDSRGLGSGGGAENPLFEYIKNKEQKKTNFCLIRPPATK